MICEKGRFVSSRHNDIRDNLCSILDEVCSDVPWEPQLQPLTGEQFSIATAYTASTARLDISARQFWSDVPQKAFLTYGSFIPTRHLMKVAR